MKKDLENLKKAVRIIRKIRAKKKNRGESTGKGLSLKVSSGGGRHTAAAAAAESGTGRSRRSVGDGSFDAAQTGSFARAHRLVKSAKVLYDHRGGFYKTGEAVVDLIRTRMS